MIDHDTPTDRIETNFNYIYPSCRSFYIIFHIILLSNTIIGAIADKKDRRKIGVFPRSNFNFDSNRQISPRSLPFQTTIHPISIRTNELVRVHSGKVIIIIIKYGEKKKKRKQITLDEEVSFCRSTDRRVVALFLSDRDRIEFEV